MVGRRQYPETPQRHVPSGDDRPPHGFKLLDGPARGSGRRRCPTLIGRDEGSTDQPIPRPVPPTEWRDRRYSFAWIPPGPELARDELTSLIKELVSREQEVSTTRQVLHGQIDALRRELVHRLRDEGNDIIFGGDILGPESAGVREPRAPRPQRGSDGVALQEPRDSEPESNAPPGQQPPNV